MLLQRALFKSYDVTLLCIEIQNIMLGILEIIILTELR